MLRRGLVALSVAAAVLSGSFYGTLALIDRAQAGFEDIGRTVAIGLKPKAFDLKVTVDRTAKSDMLRRPDVVRYQRHKDLEQNVRFWIEKQGQWNPDYNAG